jgi:hypothetical protein
VGGREKIPQIVAKTALICARGAFSPILYCTGEGGERERERRRGGQGFSNGEGEYGHRPTPI